MKPNEASRIVIGAAMKVHTALGAGVLESACDACLYYELSEAGLNFEHQVTCLSCIVASDWIARTVSISSSKHAWSWSSSAWRSCCRFIAPNSSRICD